MSAPMSWRELRDRNTRNQKRQIMCPQIAHDQFQVYVEVTRPRGEPLQCRRLGWFIYHVSPAASASARRRRKWGANFGFLLRAQPRMPPPPPRPSARRAAPSVTVAASAVAVEGRTDGRRSLQGCNLPSRVGGIRSPARFTDDDHSFGDSILPSSLRKFLCRRRRRHR